MNRLTLNCDLGESFGAWRMGADAEVMPLIDCANIACGFHAGDPSIIRETLKLAKHHKTEIGAHVAYPDLQGFGRRSMALRGQALIDVLHYQMAALDGMARTLGRKISYVKPHGALYNDMMADRPLLLDIISTIADWHTPLDLMVLATTNDEELQQLAGEHGVRLRFEAFADRGYRNNGQLIPRGQPGALLTHDQAVAQALAIAQGQLKSQRGKPIALKPDTLCVHGDTPEALSMLRDIRAALCAQGA